MVEAKHFVLVHGAAHGAWCWYRIVDLLQKAGHEATALDLTSAGVDNTDANSVTSPQQLAAPLISFLEALPDSEKVILVLHSIGGLSGTIAMERYPGKIAVAVFVAALMLPDPKHEKVGEFLQLFAQTFQSLSNAITYHFGNGADQPPTSASVNKSRSFDVFYQLSPTEDAVLANLCLKPYPVWKDQMDFFVPQTVDRYGTVPRVYIVCGKDKVNNPAVVDLMLEVLPPKQVLTIHDSDHSPFFSAPAELVNNLYKIAATFT